MEAKGNYLYDITELNNEQKCAFNDIVFKKKNVFLTSAAGTGKTYLIKKIYKVLAKEHNIGLTSLTGISALILGGQTIHSYLGIKLGTDSFEKIYKTILYNKTMLNRWRRLEILIIDEISMLSIELFEKMEQLARSLRQDTRPFGGIQLLFSGDFLQLIPVKSDKFCFESPIWNECIDKTIVLKTIMRQRDPVFSGVLNKIRKGEIDRECKDIISAREIKYISNTGLIPTMLYATNAKVDSTNKKYYDRLEGAEHTYKIKYTWYKSVNKSAHEKLVKLQPELNLKVGAQVMHLINEPKGELVNGSRGVVKEFIEGYPVVLFSNGIKRIITPCSLDVEENEAIVMSYTQIPLKLAFALTIHKAQGSTVSLVRIDFKNFFIEGQFYTALSRCETLEGLYIRNLDWNRVFVHPKALEFYKNLDNN